MKTNNLSPTPIIDVSIIVVGWNTRDLVRDCLLSVPNGSIGISYETIYVDNASSDQSAEMVRQEFPWVRVIENQTNEGFVSANNKAIRLSAGRFILLLNSDTLVLGNAIAETLAYADAHPDGAAYTCRVLNPDMSIQRNCFMFPSALNSLLFATYFYKLLKTSRFFGRQNMTWWNFDDEREVPAASGCFLLVRRSVIESVGLMDPIFYFYGDDLDWCWRFRENGWKVLFSPSTSIIHYGGQSSKKRRSEFRLQLHGADLLFIRLHRSLASFLSVKLMTSLFFAVRAPIWTIIGLIHHDRREECLQNAATYAKGFFYSTFDWKRLLLNHDDVKNRISDHRLKKGALSTSNQGYSE